MGVGTSIKRLDAVQKVTGSAKYTEDLIPANALYLKTVHSTVANGVVKKIDTAEAAAMPGVELVVTCFDVPRHKYATAGHPLSLDPVHADTKDTLILASRVRFYGDNVAFVVADTPLRAMLAAEKVKVTYEAYPPMLTPQASIGSGCTLHQFRPGNELARMDFTISPEGEVGWYTGTFSAESAFAGHDELRARWYHVPPVHACHLENNACFAYMEGRKVVVHSCNQVPHTLRRNIAEAVGIPVGDVRVVKPFIGGGFGNKQDTILEPLAAWATMHLNGRCVAAVHTREETFINSRTRHGFDIGSALCVSEDGEMTKRAIRINANGGAYAAHTHAVAAYAVTSNFQTYRTRDVQIGESSTAYTNLPPAAAMRGYGIPQLNFSMESQVEDIARARGWDHLAFRLKNINREGFTDPFDKFVVRSNGLPECIERGRELSDWDCRRRRYDEFNRTSRDLKKGLGMALFSYKIGVYPLQLESGACRILMNEDGSAQIQIGATELGQGSDTVFCQIASEVLTIPESRLTVISTQDTDVTPYDNGAYASRQTYISGSAVRDTAAELRRKILRHAAAVFGGEAASLTLRDGAVIRVESGETVCTIAQLCSYMNFVNDQKTMTEHITAEQTYTGQNICMAFGVSFVDLEVDVPLGKVRLKKVWAVHDSGHILNPQLAEAQVHGGVAMGLGYALGEEMRYDSETGRPLNNNFLDYKFPTAMDVPDIEVAFVETYEPSGPFGAKGLAEPPIIPQAAAVRNAILHATGVGFDTLPMNPQRLVERFVREGLIGGGKEA